MRLYKRRAKAMSSRATDRSESMQRRPLNISAALAIAVERQVDDIIANARAQCALRYRAAPHRGFPDPTRSGLEGFAPPPDFEDAEADRRREFDDTLRLGSDLLASEAPLAESTPEPRLDFWRRLSSLLTPRPFRA
jgi:hypothetical protein